MKGGRSKVAAIMPGRDERSPLIPLADGLEADLEMPPCVQAR
jgi:hypothetical protein